MLQTEVYLTMANYYRKTFIEQAAGLILQVKVGAYPYSGVPLDYGGRD
jgi:hypothetical protein